VGLYCFGFCFFLKFCYCKKLKFMDGMEKAAKKIMSMYQLSLPTYLNTTFNTCILSSITVRQGSAEILN